MELDLRTAIYRLWRLHRRIALEAAIVAIFLLVLAVFVGRDALFFAPLAVIAPVAHALAYPHAWEEGLVVATLTGAGALMLASIGADVGLAGLVVRLVVVAGLLLALFCAASLRIDLLHGGPEREVRARARAVTLMDAETLRHGICHRPGHVFGRISCGEADPEGWFPIALAARMSSTTLLGEETVETVLDARLVEDLPTRVTVETRLHGSDDLPIRETRSFRPLSVGPLAATLVTVEEEVDRMPFGLALGLWLTRPGADALTEALDAAEGVAMRANGYALRNSAMSDLGAWVARRNGGVTLAE
ncbi:MAG: hypothetical protein ACU0CO_13585 [Shimia sp.]